MWSDFKNFQNSKPPDIESKATEKGPDPESKNKFFTCKNTNISCRPICQSPVKNPADQHLVLFRKL